MLAAGLTFALLALPAAAAWLVAARWCRDWRLGLGYAGLAWALWAVGASELLSLGAPQAPGGEGGGGRLTRAWLVGAWSLPLLAALVVLARERRAIRAAGGRLVQQLRGGARIERLLAGGIGACLVLTLFVALAAAPNNWDSQVYHLARVATWERLGAVAHYATHVDPQLYQPPGAELLIAQGYVISGGDRLAALVQWFAYAGSIALAALAVARLGGSRVAQLAGATLVATTPLAILEASSTQNDLLLGFWLLLAAALAAHLWSGEALARRAVAVHALAASAALGMAVLTKGTGLIYGLPVGLLLAAAVVRRVGVARAALLAVVGLLLLALPSAGHWSRNQQTYGTPVAAQHAGVENPYRVGDPDASTLAANLVRNATNHLDLPVDSWNAAVERGARRLVEAVGADPDDPRTTFLGQPFRVGPFGPHEDHAGSVLLLLLGLWAAASTFAAVARRERGRGLPAAWLGVVTSQVLLFAWLITWQNWHVRLHLPVLLLVAVLIARRLDRARRGWLVAACAVALALAPLYLLFNVTRPLLGSDSVLVASRTQSLFEPRPQLQAPYREVVRRLVDAGVRDAGLVSGVDDWQYPLTVLGERAEPAVRFREVLVQGPSARYASEAALPDGVVCVSCSAGHQAQLAAAGLQPVPLDADGARAGHGDDVTAVELWLRADEAGGG